MRHNLTTPVKSTIIFDGASYVKAMPADASLLFVDQKGCMRHRDTRHILVKEVCGWYGGTLGEEDTGQCLSTERILALTQSAAPAKLVRDTNGISERLQENNGRVQEAIHRTGRQGIGD